MPDRIREGQQEAACLRFAQFDADHTLGFWSRFGAGFCCLFEFSHNAFSCQAITLRESLLQDRPNKLSKVWCSSQIMSEAGSKRSASTSRSRPRNSSGEARKLSRALLDLVRRRYRDSSAPDLFQRFLSSRQYDPALVQKLFAGVRRP